MADWAEARRWIFAIIGVDESTLTDTQRTAADAVMCAAYERGVRDAAEKAVAFVLDATVKPVLANVCRLRILALLDKEGGGDG